MTTRFDRATAILGATTAVVLGVCVLRSEGQNPPAVAVAPAAPFGDHAGVGVNQCRACHSQPNAGMQDGFHKEHQSYDRIERDVAQTWANKDPHARAYRVLLDEKMPGHPEKDSIAGTMDQVLKTSDSGDFKNGVAKAPKCLVCHAVDTVPKVSEVPIKSFAQFVTVEDINCYACHGLGGGSAGDWRHEHYQEKQVGEKKSIPWQTIDAEFKFGKYGQTDLRNARPRASLCVSCHIGNPDEGKIITHEMYAAGHPPLPPFEMLTFAGDEPKHWKGRETDRDGRDLAIGAIAALKAEMNLLAADAGSLKEAKTVDMARFDCYACHHDLTTPSDRQKRGFDGAPGRPPLKAWVVALPKVIVEHAKGLSRNVAMSQFADQFDAKWSAVKTAALSRPFGDPGPTATEAAALAKWCDEYSAELAKQPYTEADAQSLVKAIAAAVVDPKWSADTEAVMHLTWAYRSLRHSLTKDADKLTALAEFLPLHVRDAVKFPSVEGKPTTVGGPVLDQRQRLFNTFKPKDFTAKFRALALE